MFVKQYFVIHLSRNKVKLYQVSIGKSFSCVLNFEKDYNPPSLEEIFNYHNLKSKIVRILLSDDICYLVKITIPQKSQTTRDYIGSLLKEQIPEILSDNDWDYKQISTSPDSKAVLAFAPVKEFKEKINLFASRLSLIIEAIEPESISIGRHPDPIIGLALKNDLSGADDQTLNLAVNSVKKRKTPFFLIFLPLFIIFIFANLMIFKYYQNITNPTSINPKSNNAPTLTPASMVRPSPTIRPYSRSQITIKILNGSGIPGAAGKVAQKVKDLGYVNVDSGNADNSSYVITEIKIKSDEFLENYYQDFKTLFPISQNSFSVDNTLNSDVIVIIGKN